MPAFPRPLAFSPLRLLDRLTGLRKGKSDPDAAPPANGTPNGAPPPVTEARPTPVVVSSGPPPEPRRPRSVNRDVDRAVREHVGPRLDETIAELRGIAGRLDAGGRAAERLTRTVETLPDLHAELPQLGRQSLELLAEIRREAADTHTSVDALDQTVRDGHALATESARVQQKLITRQTAMMDAVREALETSTMTAHHTHETLAVVQTAAGDLAATTGRLAGALEKASKSAHQREQRMTRALERTHRWTVTAVCVCSAIATLCLVGLIVVMAR